jgi:O-antigen/teichoic acid export membrane protein
MTAPGAREARLLRNTGYLLAAFLLQKPLSFLYFNYLAGKLGVTQLGVYTTLHDLIPITLIVIDFSLSIVLTREIAKNTDRAQALLSNVMGIKVVFALLIFALGAAALAFNWVPAGYIAPEHHGLLFLVALVVALDSFTLTFFAAFRGLQNMRYESFGVLGTQIATVALGFFALRLGYGLPAAFAAILLGSVFNFTFASILLWRRARLTPKPDWHASTIRQLLAIALPFAATAVLVKLFIYTDRYILLGASHGDKFPLGVYVTAHKWTYTFEFLPAALAAALLPAMSAAFVQSKERLAYLFERSLHYLLVAGFPILVGLFVLGDRILLQFLPREFQLSVLPLRILVFALPAIFLNYPVGTLLNATNRQIYNTLSMGIALLVNVFINLVLVGRLSYTGTAIATVISSTVLLMLGTIWVSRVIRIPWGMIGTNTGRSLVAAAAMGLAVAAARPLNLWLVILLGIAVYAGALAAVGGFSRADLRVLTRALRGQGEDAV